jgi:oligo-alginate lyase
VVDQRTQNRGDEKVADKVWSERHFFDASNPAVQAMSARDMTAYSGVTQQRTMLLVRDARLPYPVVLDVFRLNSAVEHRYDYPLHFRGQIIATNQKLNTATMSHAALGNADGYQHIWREATANAEGTVKLTFLDGPRYYTMTTAAAPGTEVIIGRTGAGDPNFNLTSEQMLIQRRQRADAVFASVIEPHGFFSESQERSVEAVGRIKDVKVLATSAAGTVVEVTGDGGIKWTVMVSAGPASATAKHTVGEYSWTGNYSVQGVKP